MKKIIAFDLDGTLAESKHSITEEMAEVISKLSEQAKVIVISGGSYEQYVKQFIPNIIKTANQNLQNIILMPTNGSRRYEYDTDMKDWKETFVALFPEDIKARVKLELQKIIASESYNIPQEHFGQYIEDRVTQITFSALGQEAPIDKKSDWDQTRDKRIKIKQALETAIPEIEAHIGGMTSIDILPRNFNKAAGILVYTEQQQIAKDEVLFVGDAVFPGGNDYSPSQVGIETLTTTGPKNTIEIIRSLR